MAEVEYVKKEVFDIQIKSIQDRLSSDEKLSDARLDYIRNMMSDQIGRLEAIVEKNLAKHETIANNMRCDMKIMNERIDKNLAQYEAITNDIKGDVKAINAKFETLQNKFAWNLTLFGIIIGAVLAIIQHFWR